jgi:DNA-directed RNA polymerase sigma subunit (sigma70/sigma32)
MFAESFAKLFKCLTYREREILGLRFGICDEDGYEYTLEEVGRIFKASPESIWQNEERAIRKLQHPKRVMRARALGVLSRYAQMTMPAGMAYLARRIAGCA